MTLGTVAINLQGKLTNETSEQHSEPQQMLHYCHTSLLSQHISTVLLPEDF